MHISCGEYQFKAQVRTQTKRRRGEEPGPGGQHAQDLKAKLGRLSATETTLGADLISLVLGADVRAPQLISTSIGDLQVCVGAWQTLCVHACVRVINQAMTRSSNCSLSYSCSLWPVGQL